MNRKEIMRAVVHAVGEFNGRRLWDRGKKYKRCCGGEEGLK